MANLYAKNFSDADEVKNQTKMVSVMRLTVTGRTGATVELAEEEGLVVILKINRK